MIRSMTGYGRAESSNEAQHLTVEIKSVNNRYLDFNIRLPKKYSFLEAKIRQTLKEYIERGKVDVFINVEETAEGGSVLTYNEALAADYVKYIREISKKFHVPEGYSAARMTAVDIARCPDVLTLGEAPADEESAWKTLEGPLREAAEHFNESRETEGARLQGDLLAKLDDMAAMVEKVEEHEPEIVAAYKERLLKNVSEFLEGREVDDTAIAAECVAYADKICTDEESVRLKSHIEAMKNELHKDGSIGRKLDFLAQEMNREANTTLSKAGDLVTADLGIAMKTEVEKIREQIQNIE